MTTSTPSTKPPRLFRITSYSGTAGTKTLHLHAHDRNSALLTAAELLGPGQLLRVAAAPEGEW